jgi:pSer/pThr/pTyr-binding forkhead associated (FHA) protein
MKIIVIKDDKPLEQLTFEDGEITIGRKSDCDISIKDPAVSGIHARLRKVEGTFVIADQGSTNGIFILGKRVTEQALKHHDVVTIGEHRLRFVMTEADALVVPRASRANRGATNAIPMETSPAGVPPAVTSPRRSRMTAAHLAVRSGARKGTTITLDEGMTTIGESGVQVAAISRRPQGHFIIHVDGGKDRDRVPLVNGEPTGFKSRKLENGDRVEVAGVEMEYVGSKE